MKPIVFILKHIKSRTNKQFQSRVLGFVHADTSPQKRLFLLRGSTMKHPSAHRTPTQIWGLEGYKELTEFNVVPHHCVVVDLLADLLQVEGCVHVL